MIKNILIFCLSCCPMLTLHAQNLDEKLDEVWDLMDAGEYDQVIKKVDNLLVAYDDAPILYLLRGDALSKGDIYYSSDTSILRETLYWFEQAISIDSTYYPAYIARGNLFKRFRLLEQSVNDYSEAIKVAEDEEEQISALINRGVVLSVLKENRKAINDFKTVLELRPEEHTVYTNLALIYMSLEEYQKAEDLCQHAISLAPESSLYKNNLGIIKIKKEEYAEAEEILNEVIDEGEETYLPFALNNRGFARIHLDKLEEAEADIDRSIAIHADNSYAYKNKAILLIKKKQPAEACQMLKKANDLGYTLIYDEEVNELIDQHCNG